MRYENYRNKVLRVSEFLAKVVKHLALILAITGSIAAVVTLLLATIGLPGGVACEKEVFYGDAYGWEAKAFLSDARVEYAPQDADGWTTEQPYLPGTYRVRAVGTSAFGEDRYGKESTFEILPCPLQVGIAETSLLFGSINQTSNSSYIFFILIHCSNDRCKHWLYFFDFYHFFSLICFINLNLFFTPNILS